MITKTKNLKHSVGTAYSCVFTKGHKVLQPSKKIAFTLAEVLITIGVIGVVAAVTLPTVIQNHQKKQTVVQLKKAYSELLQAFTMAQKDFGAYEDWYLGPFEDNVVSTKFFFDKVLSPNLKIVKSCFPSSSECWAEKTYNLRGGEAQDIKLASTRPERSSFITASGYSVFYWIGKSGTNGWFFVDINGKKNPNILGKDTFVFIHGNSNFPKIGFFPYSSYTEILSRNDVITGTSLIGGCSKDDASRYYSSYTCAQLIMMDGWQIKDDYPW